MTWPWRIPLRYPNGRLFSNKAAVFIQHRLSSTVWRAMVPLYTKQRAVHVQAGPSPLAEEGGILATCHYAHSAPSSAPAAHHHGFIELIFGPMFAGKTTELLRRVEQQQCRGMKVAVVKSAKDDRYDLSHIVTHDGLKRPCYSVPSLADFKRAAGQEYHSFQVIAIDEAQFFGDLVEFCAAAADDEAKHVIVAGLDGDFQRRRFGQILDVIPYADSITKLTAKCTFCQKDEEERRRQQQQQGAAATPNGRPALRDANGSHQAASPSAAAAGAGASPNGKHLVHSHAAATAAAAQHAQQQHTAPRPALFSLRIAADSRQEVVGGADKYAPVCRHHYLRLSQVRSADRANCTSEGERAGTPLGEQ